MDYRRKSLITYNTYNNIIIIKKTKFYKKKSVINVKFVNIVEFRKYKNEKTYIKKQ